MLRWQQDHNRWEEKVLSFQSLRMSVLEFSQVVNGLTRGMSFLVSTHRLSSDLLPVSLLRSLYRDIREHAATLGLTITLPLHALYEVPASYQLQESHDIFIILHVPLVTEVFDVLRLNPFPIYLPGAELPTLFSDTNNVLIMSHNRRQFWEMPFHDLFLCSQLDAAYVCDLPIMRSDVGNTCLPALFLGDFRTAITNCMLTPARGSWYLAESAGRLFFLFTNQSLTLTTECPNNSSSKTFVSGFHNFTIPSACSVSGPHFFVDRSLALSFTDAHIRQFVWTPDILQDFTNESHKLNLRLSTFSAQLSNPPQPESPSLPTLYLALTVSLVVAFVLLLFCFGYLAYLYWTTRRPSDASTST